MPFLAAPSTAIVLTILIDIAPFAAVAQESGAAFPPPGWQAGHVRVDASRARHRSIVAPSRTAYRDLTINRAPSAVDEDDVFNDGETRYNDIASFNPAPAVTSGTQLPFGLDGIGGYGRDLGFAEGQDSSVYQRQR